jgi:hypothetical protein
MTHKQTCTSIPIDAAPHGTLLIDEWWPISWAVSFESYAQNPEAFQELNASTQNTRAMPSTVKMTCVQRGLLERRIGLRDFSQCCFARFCVGHRGTEDVIQRRHGAKQHPKTERAALSLTLAIFREADARNVPEYRGTPNF